MDQHKNTLSFDQTLEESKLLLDDASRVADEDYEFTLESILAEFGGEQPAPDIDLSPPKPAVSVPIAPLPEEDEPEDAAPEENAKDAMADIVPALDTPQSYSLQQVLERTVQGVLDEQRAEPVLEEPARRGLFSHRKMQDTEELYDTGGSEEEEPKEKKKPKPRREKPPVVVEEPEEEPEPPIEETVRDYREAMQNARQVTRFSFLITLLMWLAQADARAVRRGKAAQHAALLHRSGAGVCAGPGGVSVCRGKAALLQGHL